MKKILYGLFYFLGAVINFFSFAFNKVKHGKKLRIRGKVYVKTPGIHTSKSSIFIGDNVTINSSLRADPIGGQTHSILCTRADGRIVFEDGVGLSNTAVVAQSLVQIGAYSAIGGGTKIYDTDFHSLDADERLHEDRFAVSKPVIIGKRCFIGAQVLILKGVTIGDESVVGAGSVVTKDIPAGEIWAGNPAHFIKKVN